MMQAAKNRLRHDPQVIRKLMSVHVQRHWQMRRRLWDAGPQGYVRAPSLAMPAEQGGWLHNDKGLPPVEPPTEPGQGETGGIGGAPRRDVALLIECQLFAEKEILRRERRRGAQTDAQELQGIA